MKKILKRLVSLTAALSVCMSLIPAAVAAQVGPEPVSIHMDGSAVTVEDGKHKIKVKADLELSNDFIAAASAGNINDGTGKSKLLGLRFQCTLESDLLKEYESLNLADFKFTGDNAGSFELESHVNEQDAVTLIYKLSDEIDWLYEPAVGSRLDGKLTIETADVSKFLVEKGTLTEGAQVPMSAQVVICYADDQPIPGYDTEELQGAKGATTLSIPAIPGSGSGGSGGSGGDSTVVPDVPVSAPSYDVKVENSDADKGQVNSNITQAKKDSTVIINVEIEEGYRLTDLAVMDQKGNVIAVTRNNDGTYSFKMPASDVSIIPTFDLSAARPDKSGVSEYLNVDDHIAFMVGDDKGTFRPNARITRAEVAQIFYALLKDKNVPLTTTFTDVEDDAWYAPAVNTMAALGVVKGVGDGRFEPTRPITRAEFATIASNFAQTARDRFDFVDVDKSHWAYPYISAVSFYGWVAGVGGNKFEPDRPIVRAEAATIVNNMLGRIGDREMIDAGKGRQFPDVDKSYWGWYEIGEATMNHDHSFNDELTVETWHN